MNSNEINDRLLLTCKDGECFRLMWAYIKFGGWEEGAEVYLTTSTINAMGTNKSTVKRHRKHLIEQGALIPTGKKSQGDFDIYTVRILDPADTPAQIDLPPSSICTPPPVNMDHPLGQIDPTPRSNWSTEVKKTNKNNEATNEEGTSPALPVISQGIKEKDSPTSESSSGLIEESPGLSVPDSLVVVVTPVGSPGAAAGFEELMIQRAMHDLRTQQKNAGIPWQADVVIRKQALARLIAKRDREKVAA